MHNECHMRPDHSMDFEILLRLSRLENVPESNENLSYDGVVMNLRSPSSRYLPAFRKVDHTDDANVAPNDLRESAVPCDNNRFATPNGAKRLVLEAPSGVSIIRQQRNVLENVCVCSCHVD